MRLTFVRPLPELQAYVEGLWILEAPTGIPLASRTLAVPNGCAKLIVPYSNSLHGISEERAGIAREHGLYFVGNRIKSTHIHSGERQTGFIRIEFSPHGAYALFGIPMHEVVDEKMFDSEVLFGRWGRETRESLCNLAEVDEKVNFIQGELLRLVRANGPARGIVDFCVRSLKLSHGKLPIKELERQTGYTRRYLDLLFKQQVGPSPKMLAEIFRFQMFYQKLARGLPYSVIKDELYDFYHDQAHFSKEFKRLTGYPPREFADASRDSAFRFAIS